MAHLTGWLLSASPAEALAVFFAENLIVFLGALGFGELLVRRFASRRVCAPPGPIGGLEVGLVCSTILLNTAVTYAGLLLFRAGVVRVREGTLVEALLDTAVLLLGMDLAMYVLHRIAHVPLLYGLLHRPHHRHVYPRPLTLFVLHPAETLAFGALWLLVIVAYPPTWLGMTIYLVLNVVFGTVGHLGVEPLPERWARTPVLREVAGGAFHAGHHGDEAHNFGFYTQVWDRLFGTLAPPRGQ